MRNGWMWRTIALKIWKKGLADVTKKAKDKLMKILVVFCVVMGTLCIITSYVFVWFDKDIAYLTVVALGFYGGELLFTTLLKLLGIEKPKPVTLKPSAMAIPKAVDTTADDWG